MCAMHDPATTRAPLRDAYYNGWPRGRQRRELLAVNATASVHLSHGRKQGRHAVGSEIRRDAPPRASPLLPLAKKHSRAYPDLRRSPVELVLPSAPRDDDDAG